MSGRGRGQNSNRGGRTSGNDKDVAELKATIKNAEALLNKLSMEDQNKQRNQNSEGPKNSRGSKSLMDLSGGSSKDNERGDGSHRARGKPANRRGGGRPGGQPNYHHNPPGGQPNYHHNPPGGQPNYHHNPPCGQPNYHHNPPSGQPNYHHNPPGGQPNYHRNPPHFPHQGFDQPPPYSPRQGYSQPPNSYHPGPQPLFDLPAGPYGHHPNAPPSLDDWHGRSESPHGPYPGHGRNPVPHQQYPMPPPPYDESVGGYPRECPKNERSGREKKNPPVGSEKMNPLVDSEKKLTAEALVKALAIFRGQFEKAETIGRHLEKDGTAVANFAKSRQDIFAIMGTGNSAMIELVPKISLCSDYLSESSCVSKGSCKKLHICKTYVTGFCDLRGTCQYGHRWDTNHNSGILAKYYLDLIDRKTLHDVIKKVSKEAFKLDICHSYNSDSKCNRHNCPRLHICKSYVMGAGKCSNKDCSLNHNIVEKQCSSLLKTAGISLNETPRDICQQIVSAMNLHSKEEKPKSKTKVTCEESSDSDVKNSSNNKKGQKKEETKTCYSTDVLGDVVIPEICVYGIDNKCTNDKTGCKYLHAKSLFHWQFETKGKWYNLRIFQSKKLENAYRDVYKVSVDVPPLDKDKLEDFAIDLLRILGTPSWKADLNKLTMTNGNTELKLRRVSSQSSAVFNNPRATVYEWYYQDDQGKWGRYGDIDHVGNQHHLSNITREDIEKQYSSDSLSNMFISTSLYKYKLDFSKMIQVNLQTDKVREIRRRPIGLAYQLRSEKDKDGGVALPVHWTKMEVNQTHSLETLDPNSSEYSEVSSRLRLTLPTANILKIERLQNPYLWRLLQFRKAKLSQRYDANQLNLQKLFHGVSPEDIDMICKENFDWRQGTSAKQDYGQGSYFSNSAAVARNHYAPGPSGRIHMFLAQVIIGMVVKGDPAYTRPPSNPITDSLFDTTVDDVTAPTVFVKYDKEEYYPEYVIEFY